MITIYQELTLFLMTKMIYLERLIYSNIENVHTSRNRIKIHIRYLKNILMKFSPASKEKAIET